MANSTEPFHNSKRVSMLDGTLTGVLIPWGWAMARVSEGSPLLGNSADRAETTAVPIDNARGDNCALPESDGTAVTIAAVSPIAAADIRRARSEVRQPADIQTSNRNTVRAAASPTHGPRDWV